MIDVPVQVKDALREGNTLKNYIFDVYEDVVENVYETLFSFESSYEFFHIEAGSYNLYSESSPKAFDCIIGTTSATAPIMIVAYCPEPVIGQTETNVDFTIDEALDIFVDTLYADSLDLRVKTGEEIKEVKILTINNDKLVSESVKFDERMCSDSEIKFGLCEGTELEFQCFDVPNITSRKINAFIDVQYDNAGTLDWYSIPMGWFDVQETSRQASTGILKIKAYNKLKSDYLDADASVKIRELIEAGEYGDAGQISIHSLLNATLADYQIEISDYNLEQIEETEARGYSSHSIRICDSSGSWLNLYLHVYCVEREFALDANEFYCFDVYPKNLYTIAESNIWGAYKNNNTKVGTDGVVYTIETFAKDYYIDSYALSGEISLTKHPYSSGDQLFSYHGGVKNCRTSDYSNADFLEINVPVHAELTSSPTPRSIPTYTLDEYFNEFWQYYRFVRIYKRNLGDSEKVRLTNENFEKASKVTLRELQTAVFELNCQYGKLDRQTNLFSGVYLNNNRLLPSNSLYPINTLYPNSMSERSNKAMYSKLWADEGNVRKFRYLIITYKGTEVDPDTQQEREAEKILQRTVNADGTDDYNLSDNWLFKNLVWDDETIGDYADAMVEKMQNITWFPFEMWCAGLPYIETGDEVEINMSEGAYTSYVLRRSLKGIQNLQDEMINGTLDIF